MRTPLPAHRDTAERTGERDADVARCTACGAELGAEARFCAHCGTAVDAADHEALEFCEIGYWRGYVTACFYADGPTDPLAPAPPVKSRVFTSFRDSQPDEGGRALVAFEGLLERL